MFLIAKYSKNVQELRSQQEWNPGSLHELPNFPSLRFHVNEDLLYNIFIINSRTYIRFTIQQKYINPVYIWLQYLLHINHTSYDKYEYILYISFIYTYITYCNLELD